MKFENDDIVELVKHQRVGHGQPRGKNVNKQFKVISAYNGFHQYYLSDNKWHSESELKLIKRNRQMFNIGDQVQITMTPVQIAKNNNKKVFYMIYTISEVRSDGRYLLTRKGKVCGTCDPSRLVLVNKKKQKLKINLSGE